MSKNITFSLHGHNIFRNSIINLVGQIGPLLVAIFAVPFVFHGLGAERFGVLSLAQLLIGYFGLFDLGIARASTKLVAEALGSGDLEIIPSLVRTSLAYQVVLGICGSIVLVILTPILAEKILKIPDYLLAESRLAFYFLSIGIPLSIISINLRGILEANQRFDLVNMIKIPANCMSFIIPAIGVATKIGLPFIIIGLDVSLFFAAAAYTCMCVSLYPSILQKQKTKIENKSKIFIFGFWITVCNLLVPIIVSIDKFLISSIDSVASLGYYTVSYDIASKLLIFPASLTATLFPAFSSTMKLNKPALAKLYTKSLEYLFLGMGCFIVLIIASSHQFLVIWLGDEFAQKNSLVLQFLVLGMFLNALSQIPANLLDAAGRPDIRGKAFLLYAPFYIGLVWLLIVKMGIVGAALAWLMRGFLELVLFLFIVHKKVPLGLYLPKKMCFSKHILLFIGYILLTIQTQQCKDLTAWTKIILSFAYIISFVAICWRYILNDEERIALKKVNL
jgi:O-antigen/teichoic acid export membrane protein